jgi:hypothetical protein
MRKNVKRRRGALAGPAHHLWKGGRRVDSRGYVVVYQPAHPRAMKPTGVVFEHVLVAEKAMGRTLPKHHAIHHVNGDPSDNTPSNLVVCEDAAYHMLLHKRLRALRACGHAEWLRCRICKGYSPAPEMYVHQSGQQRHRACHARKMRERHHLLNTESP